METIFLALSAGVMMAAAAFAQYRAHGPATDPRKALLTRLLLIAAGIAFGFFWAANYPGDPFLAVLAFLIGFGVVHVPAALIFLLRRPRAGARD